MLQILAASTLPAFSKFAGVQMPASANNDALAYIGLVAVSFIVIRLFWAPYSLWKEQGLEVGKLKLALNKPERIEIIRLAKLRAKQKIKLAAVLREIYWDSSFPGDQGTSIGRLRVLLGRAVKLMGQCNVSVSFGRGVALLNDYAIEVIMNNDAKARSTAHILVNNLLDYLHGGITAEDLALRLPKDIAEGKQP